MWPRNKLLYHWMSNLFVLIVFANSTKLKHVDEYLLNWGLSSDTPARFVRQQFIRL